MAEETNNIVICKKCGKPFKKDKQRADSEQLYCNRCIIELAQQYVPEEAETPKLEQTTKSKVWTALRWIILLACLSVIAIQVPKLFSAFKKVKPIRSGTYSTDKQTDQCIKNLWHISKLLQEGKFPEVDLVCPVSKKPYVVTNIEGDIVVRCPNPELHGFKEIRVSKSSPCPEIRK